MIISLFKGWRKRRAIKQYLRRLPRLLAKDYGPQPSYGPNQVRATINRYGLAAGYSCYALAMYTPEKAFMRDHEARGESCDYNAMRREIGTAHFDGNADFGVGDIKAEYGMAASSAGLLGGFDGFDGDGYSGGGFDGGGGGDGAP